MKIFDIAKITLVAGFVFATMPYGWAQTCSGTNIVITSGQTCSSQITNNSNGTTINNDGTISTAASDAIQNSANRTIESIINTGTISAYFSAITPRLGSVITSLINSGSIFGDQGNGISLQGGSITNIDNSGAIYSVTSNGIYLNSGTSIGTLTNTGSINFGGAPYHGISNGDGTITTLNNAQGGNGINSSTTALDYWGRLPTNYNIIVYSSTHYGQLAASNTAGSTTTFGIHSSSVLTRGTYSSVLSGVTSSNFSGATTGNFDGFSWSLINSTGNIWDLFVTGISTSDTQASLANTASNLKNIFTLQNSALANSFGFDCSFFSKNNICVSAGGRFTATHSDDLNNTNGLLIAAYRPSPNYRIGAYADQKLSANNSNAVVSLSNHTPLIGLFVVWNERLDGTRAEVKVSAAYGQKTTSVNRALFGSSEAGSGSANLNSQGAQLIARYGFAVTDNVVISPYTGIRYTQNNMGAYTEATNSSVTAPLTYSALHTNATTVLAGVGASFRVAPQALLFASAGGETDINSTNGSYSATGVVGLTPLDFNSNPVKTRGTVILGWFYDIGKNHRVGMTGIYREEPLQSVSTTSVLATYTVGL